MKPINTSIYDFPTLIEGGYVYVDKTAQLYELAKPGADMLYYLPRPRRLDAILSVPGLDGIIIGPYDLSMSMNKPGEWTDPEVVAVFDDRRRRVKASGKTLGVYTECLFDVWKRRGVDYMAIKNDTNGMLLGFKTMLERFGKGC